VCANPCEYYLIFAYWNTVRRITFPQDPVPRPTQDSGGTAQRYSYQAFNPRCPIFKILRNVFHRYGEELRSAISRIDGQQYYLKVAYTAIHTIYATRRPISCAAQH
jgi:hypothetical protein